MKNWKLWAKQILVFTLAIVMIFNAVDIPVLAAAIGASGSNEVQSEKQIAESEPLEEDIKSPDPLTVTTEQETTDTPDEQNGKTSNDSNEGTYTTLSEEENEDETSQIPEITGEVVLSIQNDDPLKEGATIVATFMDEDSGTAGDYIYTWYRVDGGKEEYLKESLYATRDSSNYMIRQADIGKSFYCKVTKERSEERR